MLRRLYLRLARLWYRLVTLKTSPQKIAWGLALGIFLSYTPTFGFQMPLALGCAALLRVNPISALIGVQVTNVVTVVPIYMLCYEIGAWLLGRGASLGVEFHTEDTTLTLLNMGKRGLAWIGLEAMGGVVLGIPSALIGYALCLWGVGRFRAARRNRRIEKMRARVQFRAEQEKKRAQTEPAPSLPSPTQPPHPPADDPRP